MYSKIIAALTLCLPLASFVPAGAQTQPDSPASNPDEVRVLSEFFDDDTVLAIDSTKVLPDSILYAPDGRLWSEIPDYEAVGFALDTIVELPPIPDYYFMPAVFDHFEFADTVRISDPMFSGRPELRWLEELNVIDRDMAQLRRHVFYIHPQTVRYNTAQLLKAPKRYETTVNPLDHKIEIHETIAIPADHATLTAEEVKKRHWIRTFNASLQFSQAYVSPNWYQGGNNNLNMLANLAYNIKLNQAFHSNLMFETNVQYKLGINNAPDDELRNYSISDDIFQVISNFGLKAFNHWYYSVSAVFKTQLLNNYRKNTNDLAAAILSPGELNLGVGMTYNISDPKRKTSFNASISPLSYNVKSCINSNMNPTAFGIDEGKKSISSIGSSAELKFSWQITYNISYSSRMFFFTDYSYSQGDWENTFNFSINKFLSTMLYVHVRYDSSTLSMPDTQWHHWQVKEILSLGFNYTFKTI